MKKILSLIIAASIVVTCGLALAQEFSADMVSKSRDGVFSGKIFVGKDKVRMEMPGAITITRMDQKVAYVIMPAEKMYMEQPFDPRSVVASKEKMEGELERKELGKELVGGRMASKYQVTYELGGMRDTVLQWIDDSSKIPVKTAGIDGSWEMEYKNLKIGKQADSLFEVPSDHRKFSVNMPQMPDVQAMMDQALSQNE